MRFIFSLAILSFFCAVLLVKGELPVRFDVGIVEAIQPDFDGLLQPTHSHQ